jgi:hypothetical protein
MSRASACVPPFRPSDRPPRRLPFFTPLHYSRFTIHGSPFTIILPIFPLPRSCNFRRAIKSVACCTGHVIPVRTMRSEASANATFCDCCTRSSFARRSKSLRRRLKSLRRRALHNCTQLRLRGLQVVGWVYPPTASSLPSRRVAPITNRPTKKSVTLERSRKRAPASSLSRCLFTLSAGAPPPLIPPRSVCVVCVFSWLTSLFSFGAAPLSDAAPAHGSEMEIPNGQRER